MTRINCLKKVCDIIRFVFATVITLASLALVFYCIGAGYASLPGHPAILYPLLVFCLILLAYLEGSQVAILNTAHISRDMFSDKKRACATHKWVTANDGHNIHRYLIGRQFFVVLVVFVIAQLTTYSSLERYEFIPEWLFVAIIETGLPGALIVLSFGQLMPQLIAITHPITFLNLPGTWLIVALTLGFETFGMAHFSWWLTSGVKRCLRLSSKEKVEAVSDSKSNKDGTYGSIRNESIEDEGIVFTNTDIIGCSESIEADSKRFMVDTTLDVDVLDSDSLFSSAKDGLLANDKYASSSTRLRSMSRDSIRNVLDVYGENSRKSEKYPTPRTIIRNLIQNGKPVPRYLLPPNHPKYIMPHIVAYELIRKEKLRRKLNDQTSEEA